MAGVARDPVMPMSTRLYLDFLQSLVQDSELQSLKEVLQDITLAHVQSTRQYTLPDAIDNSRSPRGHGVFSDSELAAYGTPARRHLDPAIRQRLLSDVQATLSSIEEYLGGDVDTKEDQRGDEFTGHRPQSLLEQIELRKGEIAMLRGQVDAATAHATQLAEEITQKGKDLSAKLTRATDTIFPLHDAARSASVDLFTAAIEASLIKLSLMKEQTKKNLYTYRPRSTLEQELPNMAQAVSTAYASLKEDEKKIKDEAASLDRELLEYESVLQLVDGDNGGYQQIVNDWTKVQRETDECLMDLRRLGWTGD
ncbi:hypothetical protein D9613_006876 [Agrocybe pediades]|uniref:Uncharacterized protein n=1 Tax=Agrocybe pediades TaxID=84607 RepID=A0A8H4QGM9_9AGAR|nr:hypothetical protein D9613_006876 [Agrocybe pediades]